MVYDNRKTAGYILKGIPQFMLHSYYSQPCKKRSSVNSSTLRGADINLDNFFTMKYT